MKGYLNIEKGAQRIVLIVFLVKYVYYNFDGIGYNYNFLKYILFGDGSHTVFKVCAIEDNLYLYYKKLSAGTYKIDTFEVDTLPQWCKLTRCRKAKVS